MKYILMLATLLFAYSCGEIVIDDLQAYESGDPTIVMKVDGCGKQWVPGYAMCKKKAGEISNSNIYLANVNSNCDEDACVYFKIISQTREVVYGGQIEKGRPYAAIPWTEVIKKDRFERNDRGLWGVLMEVHWVDNEDRKRITMAEGEIRLRVYDEKYTSLEYVPHHPAFVYSNEMDGQIMKYTTGMRVFVSDGR
jgi:hypothetical protein